MAVSFERVVGFADKLAAPVLIRRRAPMNDLSAMPGPKANLTHHHGDPEIKVTPRLRKSAARLAGANFLPLALFSFCSSIRFKNITGIPPRISLRRRALNAWSACLFVGFPGRKPSREAGRITPVAVVRSGAARLARRLATRFARQASLRCWRTR